MSIIITLPSDLNIKKISRTVIERIIQMEVVKAKVRVE